MKGKTVVVTGASSGIGKVSAVELARRGARVVLVCRDRARGETALAEVKQAGAAELVIGDLSVQADLRRVAAELNQLDRIDVLVNNAGILMMERRLTSDGIESTFATNHLAYFLLTELLLDKLKAAGPSRIVNVASNGHFRARRLDLDNLQTASKFSGFDVYCASKLCNVLHTYALARRLSDEKSPVTANTLHPGAIASNWGQTDGTRWFKIMMKLGKPFLLSTEDGAKTQIYLASSPDVANVSGKYFYKCRIGKSSQTSHDVELQEKLWALSARLCGLPS
jgi:NAD(P)-dependent dehydrogenase (short-subunit alcohol dehydrogenase family)